MYMITPYMEHDLSGLLENPAVHFTEPQIKCYMLQLLQGIEYLHAVITFLYLCPKEMSNWVTESYTAP